MKERKFKFNKIAYYISVNSFFKHILSTLTFCGLHTVVLNIKLQLISCLLMFILQKYCQGDDKFNYDVKHTF